MGTLSVWRTPPDSAPILLSGSTVVRTVTVENQFTSTLRGAGVRQLYVKPCTGILKDTSFHFRFRFRYKLSQWPNPAVPPGE